MLRQLGGSFVLWAEYAEKLKSPGVYLNPFNWSARGKRFNVETTAVTNLEEGRLEWVNQGVILREGYRGKSKLPIGKWKFSGKIDFPEPYSPDANSTR